MRHSARATERTRSARHCGTAGSADMGAAITTLFANLSSQATLRARSIATAVIIGIGLTLTMMPWEHGAVRFLKDSALRVAVGLAIVLNAAAIVATMAGG